MIYTLCQSVFRTPTKTAGDLKTLSRPQNPLPGYSGNTLDWLGALPTRSAGSDRCVRLHAQLVYLQRRADS